MTAKTRTSLKGVFEQGDKPQGSDYVDLIDSPLNLTDSTAQTVTSPVTFSAAIRATGVSANTIQASASSRFYDALSVAGPFTASATSSFSGPVSVGSGGVVLSQYATVETINSGGNPITFTVPASADVLEFYIDVVVPMSAGTLNTAANLEIGVSGSNAYFAIIPVSATSGTRILGSSHVQGNMTRWKSFADGAPSSDIRAHITAQSLATAMTGGQLLLTITYIQNA